MSPSKKILFAAILASVMTVAGNSVAYAGGIDWVPQTDWRNKFDWNATTIRRDGQASTTASTPQCQASEYYDRTIGICRPAVVSCRTGYRYDASARICTP